MSNHVSTALARLPDIHSARLPAIYVKARVAMGKCARIDECQEWANKAQALASYAKQSKDKQLWNMAVRIKARAIRRCGQLLKEILPKQGGGDRGAGRRSKNSKSRGRRRPVDSRAEMARDAGLSDRQRKTALRVATVPSEEFDQRVESETPPSVTELAAIGTQSKNAAAHAKIDVEHFGLDLAGHRHDRGQ